MAKTVFAVTVILIWLVVMALTTYMMADVTVQETKRAECRRLGYTGARLSGYPDFQVVCIYAVPLADLQEQEGSGE